MEEGGEEQAVDQRDVFAHVGVDKVDVGVGDKVEFAVGTEG